MLMREIRRELGVSGANIRNADQYTVYLGKGAYSEVCTWLQDTENPTADRVRIRFDGRLRPYKIDVRRTHSIGVGSGNKDSH